MVNIEDFKGIPTGNIADSGMCKGIMEYYIQPLDRHMEFAGRALTVQVAGGDNLTIHKAVLEAKEGDVLIISCGGYLNAGCFGEMLAICSRARGIQGVVIDGSCRDSLELIEMKFPTYVRGVNPTATSKYTCGAVNCPTMVGGVKVCSGDIVVGDADGVVVISPEKAESVLAFAKEKKEKEDYLRPRFAKGESTAELLGLMNKIK